MAEVVGVVASAITLAALFSSCIDCFSYFKAAQNCPAEAESLLVKLDCEKARLLVWANTVGILQTNPTARHPRLADVKYEDLIRRCISQIVSLLTDARRLQDEYGSRTTHDQENQHYLAVLSVNSMTAFQSARRTFFARAGTRNAKPTLLSRIKWAVKDAARFRVLLVNLRDFVDHLIQLLDVAPETIADIVEEDIASTVDIESLRLIENGCDESSYPRWSARASEAIRDSEMGTVDRRNLMEILADTEVMSEVKLLRSQTMRQPSPISEARYSSICLKDTIVVLTESCLNVQADGEGLCAVTSIGDAIVNPLYPASFANSGIWSLGRRISDAFGVSDYKGDKTTLQVYCGACACAINTARMFTKDLPWYVDLVIRIDDRLSTSCRDSDSMLDALEAIRDAMEDYEVGDGEKNPSLQGIDCPSLERRIYDREDEPQDQPKPAAVLQELMLEQSSYQQRLPNCRGTVIIAENDVCSESFNYSPIRRQSRKSRAGEMYKFNRATEGSESARYEICFIGRLSRSKACKTRHSAYKDASQFLDEALPTISRPTSTTKSSKRLSSVISSVDDPVEIDMS